MAARQVAAPTTTEKPCTKAGHSTAHRAVTAQKGARRQRKTPGKSPALIARNTVF
jgi:hypothetical protein